MGNAGERSQTEAVIADKLSIYVPIEAVAVKKINCNQCNEGIRNQFAAHNDVVDKLE